MLLILKKGKGPTDPSNYRSISLTPNLSKIYKAVINKKINKFCYQKSIIPDYHFGFKYQHSTTHAINKLLSDLNSEVGGGGLVGAALLDIEKAFDSV